MYQNLKQNTFGVMKIDLKECGKEKSPSKKGGP